MILYADDTVVFYSGKNIEEIRHVLLNDLENLATWFKQNNLIITNMRIEKAEFVLRNCETNFSKDPLILKPIYELMVKK